MSRIWLAALLGVILGLGIGFASTITTANVSPREYLATNTSGPQLQAGNEGQTILPNTQFVLLAFLVGLVVGAPFFLMAKSRSR
jgi:uncharacterized membrane-anchored protein YhcB (DUF1043 family)